MSNLAPFKTSFEPSYKTCEKCHKKMSLYQAHDCSHKICMSCGYTSEEAMRKFIRCSHRFPKNDKVDYMFQDIRIPQHNLTVNDVFKQMDEWKLCKLCLTDHNDFPFSHRLIPLTPLDKCKYCNYTLKEADEKQILCKHKFV